ncbi:hypothetical protein DEI99_014670 [Curtobacterium sp. MCLR17_036]|uniref:hypothetical protein n=1 Tax=Curtobacterium sp. MCLR17_036 TaxID=2175620 RepID=UPI0024DFA4A2|nr:hypothetical protein [Curtobacterium sp. MCLR17_036]WIE64457.1 hypothetical protein DEI99_014670 [Curtobacterium sp. MCLR17_036]
MPKKFIALATAGLALTLLAGCASGPSKAEQCDTFEKTVKSAAQGVQQEATKLQSDPDAAVKKLKELDDTISDGVDDLSDDDLQQKGEAFEDAYGDLVDQIEDVADDPKSADVQALTKSSTKVQETGNAFEKACNS